MTIAARVGRGVVLAAVLLLAHARSAVAQEAAPDAVHDAQAWGIVLALLPLGDAWTAHAEFQPRWNDDVARKDQFIYRGALGRHLSPRVSVWGGYAYAPRWNGGPRQDEQRIWEQLSASFPKAGAWAPSIRIRMEHRLLDEWDDASHRLRMMGRFVRPLGASPWSAVLWNEYMVNFDDTGGGPGQGFDQNRLFVGALRKVAADVTFEGGYMWQLQPATSARGRRHGHTALVWVTWAPPRP